MTTLGLYTKSIEAEHEDLIVLPKSFYEFMPYLYAVIGTTAALALYNSYAIISEVLFLTVALMIFYMRLKTDRSLGDSVLVRETGEGDDVPLGRNAVARYLSFVPREAGEPL